MENSNKVTRFLVRHGPYHSHKDGFHRHEEEMYKMVIANLEERQKVHAQLDRDLH